VKFHQLRITFDPTAAAGLDLQLWWGPRDGSFGAQHCSATALPAAQLKRSRSAPLLTDPEAAQSPEERGAPLPPISVRVQRSNGRRADRELQPAREPATHRPEVVDFAPRRDVDEAVARSSVKATPSTSQRRCGGSDPDVFAPAMAFCRNND